MNYLGVDGGTTKTVALVADGQGRILGAARGGGSNWAGDDVEIPMAVVVDTVRDALDRAGIQGADVATGVFTLAGADWPEDHTRREAFLSKAGIAQRVMVKNDSFGGLRAGTSQPYGMVLAAGTGMNAAVITPEGVEWAYGYYETFGGAKTVSQDAFEAVLRAEDGRGQPTSLTGKILDHFKMPTVEALLRAAVQRQIDHEQYLSVCPLVFEASIAGDAIASEIIIRQGLGLAEYITAMARRFKMQDLAFDVVLVGSVFKGVGPLLVDTITQTIQQAVPKANIVRARFETVVGSLLLAYDASTIQVTQEMIANLSATVPDAEFFNTLNSAGYRSIRQG